MFPLDPIIRQKLIDFIDVREDDKYDELIDMIIEDNGVTTQIKTIRDDIITNRSFLRNSIKYIILCDKINYSTKIINGFTFISYTMNDVGMRTYKLGSQYLYKVLKNLDEPLARYDPMQDGQTFKLNDFIYLLRTEDDNVLIHVNTINEFREKMNGLICSAIDE
jgi:hypothetical protein